MCAFNALKLNLKSNKFKFEYRIESRIFVRIFSNFDFLKMAFFFIERYE